MGCPGEPDHTSDDNIGRFVQHANEILELINQHFEYGGKNLFSIFPREVDDKDDDDDEDENNQSQVQNPRQLAKQTLLGQWMAFTQNLMRRVATLEREVVNLREAFSREWERKSAANDETAEPDLRDGFSISGINDALIAQLHTELDTSEDIAVKREQRARARGLTAHSLRQGSRQWQRASDGSMQTQVGGDDEPRVPDNIVAWIECSSRIYRVQGSEIFFVVPAWDIRPGVDKVREIEETPLVVTVPVRGRCMECGGTVGADGGGDGSGGGGKGKAVNAYGKAYSVSEYGKGKGKGKPANAYGQGRLVHAYGKGKPVVEYGKGKSTDAYGNLLPSPSEATNPNPGISSAARGMRGYLPRKGGAKGGGKGVSKRGPGVIGRGKHPPGVRGPDADGGEERPRRIWQETTDEYLERIGMERDEGDGGEEYEEGEEGEEDDEGEEDEDDEEGGEDEEDG